MEHGAVPLHISLHNSTSVPRPISVDSTVVSNAACRVLSMHSAGSMRWYTSDGVAYGLHGHQVYVKPILITQSKLRLNMIAHDWWEWPCICLQTVLVPKYLLGGKTSSLAVA